MATSNHTETEVKAVSGGDIPSPDKSKGLSGAALCRRFGLEKSAISAFERRNGVNSEAFKAWSAKHDRDGVAWVKRGGKYFPDV